MRKELILVVEPDEKPYLAEHDFSDYKNLQRLIGSPFSATYPFADPVAIVHHDEGKLNGMPLNRALFDESGCVYDIVAGTFAVVGLGTEDFCGLTPALAERYIERFAAPEQFALLRGEQIVAINLESNTLQKFYDLSMPPLEEVEAAQAPEPELSM